MTNCSCSRLRRSAALVLPIGLVALLAGAAVSFGHTDPPGASITAVDHSLVIYLDPGCNNRLRDVDPMGRITSCQTIYLQARLQYASQVQNAASFEGGAGSDWRMLANGNAFPGNQLGNVPCLGDPGLSQDDPNSAANNNRGICAGTSGVQISQCLPYTPTPADILAGSINFEAKFGDPNPNSPNTAYAHLTAGDLPGVSSSVPNFVTILTCGECQVCDPGTDSTPGTCLPTPASTACSDTDGNLCTIAGCDGVGTCNQDHQFVACQEGECFEEQCNPSTGQCERDNDPVSTPCIPPGSSLDDNLCTTAGCDGQGTCSPEHIVTTCPDGECGTEACDPATGACVPEDPFPASTPCTDTDGNQCTTAGCDGAGACNQDHEVVTCDGECIGECNPSTGLCDPEPDSTPCTDTGLDCWIAGCEQGVCVQEHIPEPESTTCDEVAGTECANPGCDGQGNCVPDHIPVQDSSPCTDTGLDCWIAGCEAGVCVQEHVPEPPSTTCDDIAPPVARPGTRTRQRRPRLNGSECASPGCDGQGNCVPDHIPAPDSTPCTDTGLDCWIAGCEAGVCVQEHVPEPPSTVCDEVSGTECANPGCDGQGNCVPDHIPLQDSTPCTDTGLDCWIAGCEQGVCVQEHIPAPPSTVCDEVSGTECANPGCDGQGNCVPDHIPLQDSTPCTDTGLDCWIAGCEAGVCVQEHVPAPPSVPCDEVAGTECADPGCDGQGNCVPDHIPVQDSRPCGDTGLDCWIAGCEAGVCVQEHVPAPPSTVCDEVAGTECTRPGCDGQGNCVPDHIPLPDSTPCADTGLDCWMAGCEAGVCVQEHIPAPPSQPCDEVSGTECAQPGCDGYGHCQPDHIPVPDSTPCTDTGLDCWIAGCEAGVCVQTHVPTAASTPCTEADATECGQPGCDGAGNCMKAHIPEPDSTPCTDTGLDCWIAGCEAGVCVQTHLPEQPSTPCDPTNLPSLTGADNECADPGCDGLGNCVPDHIPVPDSTPCADTGLDCWIAGCEAGVCVQTHVPTAASTPCSEANGTECADPGCDGQGNCMSVHIPKPDSTPCTDTGADCWIAGCESGYCVQTHVPEPPSTPCNGPGGECASAGCDGGGNCVDDHAPVPDSTPCTDTGLDCWMAGCEAGVCVQTHVPTPASTPCDPTNLPSLTGADNECADPGCDGLGNCVPDHIPVADSTPCTDTGQDCWIAGCESGYCVQAHIPEAPSTPCSEANGTECADPGCDGSGNCMSEHIPKPDSTPCTDTGLDCWIAGCEAGECVQTHVPEAASTPCSEANGTECADPGCDGSGNCMSEHIPKPDSTPCTDTGLDCWIAGCEAGECVQTHVPEAASTPCSEANGTECADPGCDGSGNCMSEHIPKPDSTPCTDTGLDCWIAGCEGGYCVQAHIPEPPSTPCDEATDTECADPGCDGAGNCSPLHVPEPDSTPCTDTGEECWIAGCEGGHCVQRHVPEPPSTPCTDDDGNLCTDAGCDGTGSCSQDHVVTTCTDGVCFTEACDPSTGECVRTCEPDGIDDCEITIGDFIWDDFDADGSQNDGMTGIEDVDLNLIDCSLGQDQVIATTTTVPDGFYSFTVAAVDADCMPTSRDLLVEIDGGNFGSGQVLNGYDGSPKDNAGDAFDSDCDPLSSRTDCMSYADDDFTIDCGFFLPCELEVTKTCLVVPPPPSGDDCDGKVIQAVFRYTGEDCSASSNSQGDKAKCEDLSPLTEPVQLVYTGGSPDDITVDPADESVLIDTEVSVTATGQENLESNTKLEIRSGGTLLQRLEIHTSCSKPLAVGNQFGSLLLTELTTTEGGTVGLPDTEPSDVCTATGNVGVLCEQRPSLLSLRVTGEDCTTSNNTQDSGKWSCNDVAPVDPQQPVEVYAASGSDVYLNMVEVPVGGIVTLDPTVVGRSDMDSEIDFQIHQGGLVQEVTFHTSCSQDLRTGDTFGGLEVWSWVNDDQGLVQIGVEVEYEYTITNLGPRDVVDIEVVDHPEPGQPFEVDGSPIALLAPDESVTLTATRTIDETTANEVIVSGHLVVPDGPLCEGSAMAAVIIEEPPVPPGSCDDGKPYALVFEYTGEDCSATTNQQEGSLECNDLAPLTEPVRIVVTQDASDVTVTPGDETIAIGSLVTFQATGSKLKSNLVFDIRQGSSTLQDLKIHTSCSKPLAVGDQFGSMILREFIPEL